MTQINNSEKKNTIVLMGIKHCGKSTQGKLLAKYFDVPFYDTDDVLSQMTGLTARELFSAKGEDAFKAAEKDACTFISKSVYGQTASTDGCAPTKARDTITCVVATGGGICNNDEALSLLHHRGLFVFLCADESLAADRITREASVSSDGMLSNIPAYIAKKSPHSIAEVREIFHEFYVERVKRYSEIADVTVQMQNAPKQVNLQKIIDAVLAVR